MRVLAFFLLFFTSISATFINFWALAGDKDFYTFQARITNNFLFCSILGSWHDWPVSNIILLCYSLVFSFNIQPIPYSNVQFDLIIFLIRSRLELSLHRVFHLCLSSTYCIGFSLFHFILSLHRFLYCPYSTVRFVDSTISQPIRPLEIKLFHISQFSFNYLIVGSIIKEINCFLIYFNCFQFLKTRRKYSNIISSLFT